MNKYELLEKRIERKYGKKETKKTKIVISPQGKIQREVKEWALKVGLITEEEFINGITHK